MDKFIKNRRRLEQVMWPVPLQVRKQIQKNSFILYILSDQVWWCNVKQFWSYFKNYMYKFMQTTSWHNKSFLFHISFWIWKLWKGREENTKTWISREQKELFRWNLKKTFFIVFKKLSFGEKNKNLVKNSGHKF